MKPNDATLEALKCQISELEDRRKLLMKLMKPKRKESLAAFYEYRLLRSEYFKIGKAINEIRDDLRRISNGK